MTTRTRTTGDWVARGRRYLWGRSREVPAVPLHYPLVAVLAIVASVATTTWFLPRERGYLLSFGVLLLIIAYGVVFTSVRLTTDPIFAVLFGGYWLGLVAHYYYAPHQDLLQYILVTPVAVFATVVVLSRFIAGRRQTFAMALTGVAVVAAVIGFVMLWQELGTEEDLYRFVGEDVMGLYSIRTSSVFHNPNTYGFFMMVGSLTALYTALSRRGLLWVGALAVCVGGMLVAEGDAALVGLAVGVVILLSGVDRRLGMAGIGLAVLGAYIGIRIGHVPHVMETTLLGRIERWILAVELLAQHPLLGIGFIDPALVNADPRFSAVSGPHNSYIHVLLNTGVIAGGLYLGALVYALGRGVRQPWTPWTAYVVGLATGVFLFMGFESLFLGGLSVTSVVLGLAVGLLLHSDRETRGRTSPTTVEALERSRAGRAIKRLQGRSHE